MKGWTASKAVALCFAASVVLAGCSPQQLTAGRSAPTRTPTTQLESSSRPGLTAEQGLQLVMEAWSTLSTRHPDQPNQVELLRRAWAGVTAALPAGQAPPPFPPMSDTPDPEDLSRFRITYMLVTAQAPGGREGQANIAYSAVRGMTESFGDCNTFFRDAQTVGEQAARAQSAAAAGGVGIRIKHQPNESVLIWELLEGGAAGKAGIKPGDVIVKVDGRDVQHLTTEQVASAIRGPEGTQVKLTVERADGKRTQEFSLKRARLDESQFMTRWLKGDVAYFRLFSFSPAIEHELLTAIREYESKNPKGWIFDLRTNPAEDYASMASLLSKLVKNGPFALERDRSGQFVFHGPDGSFLPRQHPFAVLVGDSTASAAEMFAAVVEHQRAGTVVGTRTRGCTGRAGQFQLSDGSVLSVTTRHVLTPTRENLNAKGLTPRITVDVSREDLSAGRDPQLDRALTALGVTVR